jgi:hypothetical protein
MTAVKPMEGIIDSRIIEWTEKLETDFAKPGKKLDFAPWATFFAYDVISEIGFGKALGFVKKGMDIDGLIQSFHDGLPAFGIMCRLHPLTKWIKNTWVGEKFMIPKPGDSTGIGNIMKVRALEEIQVLFGRLTGHKVPRRSSRRAPERAFQPHRKEENGSSPEVGPTPFRCPLDIC